MSVTKVKRIEYVDQLRTASIIGLVCINVSFLFSSQSFGSLEEYVLFSSLGFGVPIFLMLLGLLMLERDYSDLNYFFKFRFVKILFPFLIWNTIMAFLATIHNHQLVFNFKYLFYFGSNFMLQHWYAWMLLGLYLSLPILSEFIRMRKLKGAEYFLVWAIVASIIYQLLAYFDTPSFFNLTFFIGPIIYSFLGYYLDRKNFNMPPNTLILIGIILFLISTLYIVNYDVFIKGFQRTIFLHHYNFYTRSSLDVSIIAIMQATGVFLIFKYLNSSKCHGFTFKIKSLLTGKIVGAVIQSISRACYGIYLIHQSILLIFTLTFNILIFNNILGIVSFSIITFIVSWAIIVGLNKLGVPTKYIGYD